MRRLKIIMIFIFTLVFLLSLAGFTNAETKEELQKEIETLKKKLQELESRVEKTEKVQTKQETVLTEKEKETMKEAEKIIKALKGWKFGGLWYISYQNGEKDGKSYNQFVLKRGYINIYKQILPWFSVRVTPDIVTADDKTSNLAGSVMLRLKYAYAKFDIPEFAFFTKPFVEVGMVHMPWLDFEEHVNFYRCQDTMFLERNSLFNSADIGITFVSLFGGTMPEEYQKKVNSYYPGKYGSMSFGIYNGGGYHASEKNKNKVFEGRLTLRPLPDIVPGLQLSYFGIVGKGNKDTNPDWNVNLGFVSYEHEYFTVTGQYYVGKGNQKGDDENSKKGYSFFAEIKPHKKFSILGRYDYFDPNKDVKDNENKRYIVGVAYHIDKPHKNMVVLDYDKVDYKQKGKPDDDRVQLTLQLSF